MGFTVSVVAFTKGLCALTPGYIEQKVSGKQSRASANVAISTKTASMTPRVDLLEETCHGALQKGEDPSVQQALVEALLVFYVDAPDDAAVIKGLCNIARVRADPFI